MDFSTRLITMEDYDAMLSLWNSTEQSRRALNPVDDSREGIERYLKRNPSTCFGAFSDSDGKLLGVILTGLNHARIFQNSSVLKFKKFDYFKKP